MRRRTIVVFALLASLLVVASMPASASHKLNVASIHTTDSDFNAGALTNMSVSGSGDSATVILTQSGNYSVVDDSGGGATDGSAELAGDNSGGSPINSSFKIRPQTSGNISDLYVDIASVDGSDYGFTVDIYIVQENPDTTYAEGTKVDTWDPSLSPGLQRIQLDTEFEVSADTNYTIEFVTTSSDDDATPDRLNIKTDSSFTTTWRTVFSNQFSAGGDIIANISTAATTPATYISQNHTVENSEQGFVNITDITNATATVTWESNNGSGWSTLNQTSGITTAANHTFSWPTEPNETVRVNVTVFNQSGNGEPAFTMADEGVQFTASQPTVNNSSATPNGTVKSTNPTLSIDANDTDFGLAQGDTVTVEFLVDGSSEGTDTLTANGTASLAVTLDGGDHTWSVQANDSYGHSVDSATFSADVPANLTIRNETTPHGIVSGCTANVRFYETTDDNPLISEQTDSDGDGNVSLVGLPVGTEFVATVKCDGYWNRTVLINDIFSQSNVFLLHQATNDGDLIRFEIDDRTGLFAEEGEFIIERAINESEYSSADGFDWVRIAGDEIGATDSFVITLEHETRYRLRIQNDAGDSRILKTYIPQGDETEQVVVGRVDWESSEGNATVFNASIEDESTLGNTPPVIQIQFVNPANLTAEPEKAISNFNYSVFEAGNASNEIGSGSASGDLGTFYAETNITDDQADEKWIIQVEYEADGDTVLERRVVGGAGTDIQADQDWLGLFALFGITSIGLLYGQRTASIGIALMWLAAGVAMVFELIMINQAWYIVSGFIVAAALIRGEIR